MTLFPAPAYSGIVFLRKHGDQYVPVRAGADRVVGTQLCTSIGENGTRVQTVEHLLSALSGLGVDNLLVRLDSSEIPILDGSAEPFISLLLAAGIEEMDQPQPMIRVTRPVSVQDGNKFIILSPVSRGETGLTISCTIRFEKPVPIRQTRSYEITPEIFSREIARARTFGFLSDVEALRSKGLARGGSLANAVVVSEDGVMNEEGLRYNDEFVRHKILDLIGDLSLLGRPLIGSVEAYCPGHELNARLVSKILTTPNNWVLEGLPEQPESRPFILSPTLAASPLFRSPA
jgi:UDP-3-O-[3-hydroxymyristoyl] N-acetylglucosamine deacetylase